MILDSGLLFGPPCRLRRCTDSTCYSVIRSLGAQILIQRATDCPSHRRWVYIHSPPPCRTPGNRRSVKSSGPD